jgi:crotonobetainyl-CoA:carnitine CoA-transferase CaiB-like acyl-CoA transferase
MALAGPFCSMLLADLGADVIKIESPDGAAREGTREAAYHGESGHFLIVNRNKRGITLDLKSEAGREVLYRLARSADVFVQNFRPGVMARLGCDYVSLREVNPRLVYCSISGFGEGSPYADLPGFDIIAQGMSGLMSITGQPDGGDPVKVGTPISDMGAGMYGALGVVSALLSRQLTGCGQHVETSLLDTPISWLTWRAAEWWGSGEVPGPQGSGFGVYRAFKCSDGRWITIGPSARLWGITCRTLGVPELIDDPRFASPNARQEHHTELEALAQAAFLERTSAEWIAAFQAAGVPTGPIRTVAEVLDEDPHVRAREMVVEVEHPTIGRMKTLGLPIKLSDTPGGVTRAAPLLGQHTEEVLRELGYADAEIARLREIGAI